MFLDKKSLKRLFLAALFFTLFVPIILPGFQIYFLAPVVVVAIYQKSRLGVCWIAMGCGLIMDLLYAQDRFGPYTISFMGAAMLVYPQKRHFFADNWMTLPIMTYLYSFAIAILQFLYVKGFERGVNISLSWALIDMVLLPILDSIIAFTLFAVPSLLVGSRPRRGEEYFAE